MNQCQVIDPTELQERLESGSSLILLDVRLPDDFEAEHLPEAVNHCVFEVGFFPAVEEAFPDRARPICVYGACSESHESSMALEKLGRAGFQNLAVMREGMRGWKAAGLPTQTGEPLPVGPSISDGVRKIDLKESRLEWLGRNLLNKHWGTLGLSGGSLRFSDGQLRGGDFSIDMRAMVCLDLEGNPMHDVLIDHLQSDDFFDVDRHPEAKFVLNSAELIQGTVAGARNLRVEGNLTLRGITRALSFEAAVGITPEGKPAAQASFTFDRTKWEVLYGSGKFFQRLAGHLVNDDIEMQVRIVTE